MGQPRFPQPHRVRDVNADALGGRDVTSSVVGDVDLTKGTDAQWTSLRLFSDSVRQQYADRDAHCEYQERRTIDGCDRSVAQAGLFRGPGE